MSKEHFEPVTAKSLAKVILKTMSLGTYYEDHIEAILEPHIGKPSYDKSVPERCEEAYDEAVRIIKSFVDTFELTFISDANSRKAKEFLQKPNPFKEAKIVPDDVDVFMDLLEKEKQNYPEPQLLPFDLKAAQEGAKVVTRDGTPVKIVSDNIDSDYPILYVGNKKNGKQFYNRTDINGIDKNGTLTNSIFILKEPEEIEVTISRDKINNRMLASVKGQMRMDRQEIIKTITVTI